MRNVTVIENHKRKNFRQLFITLAVATLGFLAIFIMVSVISNNLNYKNVTEVQGIISEVVNQEDSYNFIMDNSDEYILNSIVSGKVDDEKISLLQGQNATIYIMNNEIIGFTSDVYTIDGQEGFQIIKDNYRISMIIIGVLAGVLLLSTIFAMVKFLLEKKLIRGDIFKLINNRQVAISQIRKQYFKFAIIPFILMIICLIPMVIYSNPIGVLFYVFLGIFWLCFISGFVLSLILLPFIKKREIDAFDNALDFNKIMDIDKEHNPYIMDVGNYLTFKIQEDGLLYRSEFEADFIIETFKNDGVFEGQDIIQVRSDLLKEIKSQPRDESGSMLVENCKIKFSELNLTTKVVFRSANEPIKIFVCSKFNENQYPSLKNDLYFEFDEDLYFYIKKYSIKVEGLEKCLKNRKEYMDKYCKGKIRYVDITENSEIELFNGNK